MNTRSLAETVILQAIEDMCSEEGAKGESLEYFLGEGFSSWAELAGMSREDQQELLKMLQLPTGPVRLKKLTTSRSSRRDRTYTLASACA